MRRLAILSTHPIQYNAPLFRMLNEDQGVELQVFFSKTWNQVKFDPDFQREVVWDIPVSEGYPHATYDASSKAGKTSLVAAIRDFNPDTLLVYGWNFPGHLAMMRHFHGSIPIWFRGDSHLLDPLPLWKKALRRLWLTWVYRHIDFAFTVGSANEAYFEWCGLKPHQMARAPHAVDNDFFEKDDNSRREEARRWRSELGIEPTDHAVLFAGKLEPKKQPGFLLQAWHDLGDSKSHILIVGSGPEEQDLQRKWADVPGVYFLGFQNQQKMPTVYRMADVFCLPSAGPGETWGLAINEALASGVPCIVSDRAGCAQDMGQLSQHVHVASPKDRHQWTQILSGIFNGAPRASIEIPRPFSHDAMMAQIHRQFNHE